MPTPPSWSGDQELWHMLLRQTWFAQHVDLPCPAVFASIVSSILACLTCTPTAYVILLTTSITRSIGRLVSMQVYTCALLHKLA